MRRVDSPIERTTAATDAILAVLALAAAIYLPFIGQQHPWKANIWTSAFAVLAMAAALGAIAHGLHLSNIILTWMWRLLYLALGQVVALFMAGTVYDLLGAATARPLLPAMLLVGVIFFAFTLIRADTFFVFIIYQAVVMAFALGGYIWLALAGLLDGAWLMVVGILVTMIAAGVQAGRAVAFTFIWQFDHNGVYHLIQMVGIVLLAMGLRMALLS